MGQAFTIHLALYSVCYYALRLVFLALCGETGRDGVALAGTTDGQGFLSHAALHMLQLIMWLHVSRI